MDFVGCNVIRELIVRPDVLVEVLLDVALRVGIRAISTKTRDSGLNELARLRAKRRSHLILQGSVTNSLLPNLARKTPKHKASYCM